jgi:hypothetical protein
MFMVQTLEGTVYAGHIAQDSIKATLHTLFCHQDGSFQLSLPSDVMFKNWVVRSALVSDQWLAGNGGGLQHHAVALWGVNLVIVDMIKRLL